MLEGTVEGDAAKLRAQARHCRELAKGARDSRTMEILRGMANDLDDEAERLDAEDRRPKN